MVAKKRLENLQMGLSRPQIPPLLHILQSLTQEWFYTSRAIAKKISRGE